MPPAICQQWGSGGKAANLRCRKPEKRSFSANRAAKPRRNGIAAQKRHESVPQTEKAAKPRGEAAQIVFQIT